MFKVASTNGEVEGMWLKGKKKLCETVLSHDVGTAMVAKGPVVSEASLPGINSSHLPTCGTRGPLG